MLLLALALMIQDAKLPPAEALPPPDGDTAAVLSAANALLGSLSAADPGAAILAQVRPEGGATAVVENADGSRTVTRWGWKEFAARFKPGGPRLAEKLYGPAVDVDGDIAMVWSPYVFHVDGKLSHCGTDHFEMIRENGQWRVLNLSWTQRTTGCPAK